MQKKPPARQRRGPIVLVPNRPVDYSTGPTRTTKKTATTKKVAVASAAAPPAASYNETDTLIKKKMGFRRTMRRWFGGRYKQMSSREVDELDRQITAEMRAGTFRAVQRGPQPTTADELWEGDGAGEAAPERLPTMTSSVGTNINRPPTSASQASRGNRYYHNHHDDDEYGDDYGGYQDGLSHAHSYGGGGASSDSGYAAGYFERPGLMLSPPLPPPPIPLHHHQEVSLPGRRSPAWYVPGGGPFDLAEAKPESVYDGGSGSRANSMRSNVTRGSTGRRSATQQQGGGGGYYPPSRTGYRGEGRSYSALSDPGRLYARSPMPRVPYVPVQAPWDEQSYGGGGGEGGYEYGRGGGGHGYYRGWNGESIVEHEYPIDNRGYGENYHYRGG